MPITYRTRPDRCSTCGDVVLIAEGRPDKLFGSRVRNAPKTRLEHADPSPDGTVFDAVDEGCRRARVDG